MVSIDYEKASNLSKVLNTFTEKWQNTQNQINKDFLTSQKSMFEEEFQKQREWEEKMLAQELAISQEEREESKELFKALINAINGSSK